MSTLEDKKCVKHSVNFAKQVDTPEGKAVQEYDTDNRVGQHLH